MKDKPTKEMVMVAKVLKRIDILDKLISKDVSYYVKSIDPKNLRRRMYREKSDTANRLLGKFATKFAEEKWTK